MAPRILFLSPGFPYEMPRFCAGLAEAGAEVVGLGDQPEAALPQAVRSVLSGHLRLDSLWDEEAVVDAVRRFADTEPLDGIECLWEPGMLIAGRLRDELALPGMGREATLPFRDKELMKQRLDEAGIRTPRHRRCATEPRCREAAEELGYPLVIKPIAGAGSADTHRLEDAADLERVLPTLRHVDDVSVEEYVEGEEHTFDTVCVGGRILFENVAWYRPKPMVARSIEWISPQTVNLRDLDDPTLAGGRELGRAVLAALGFGTGFTHMEWFRTPGGEAVFGEIGARPPGARSVAIMNYGCAVDLYRGWGEAVVSGRFSQSLERPFNAAVVFKRAAGSGRIQRIEGLAGLLRRYGPHVVEVDLLQPGDPRRDWKQTLLSDGHVIVRHPDLAATLEMADRVGTDLRLFAA